MDKKKLEDLYMNMQKIHERARIIFEQEGVPSMLKNEYKNKVSQYDGMYDSVETMKQMSSKEETIDNLINQQIEILNVRISWELDWAKRAASKLN